MATVSQVRALPDGRVLVNDLAGRRLLIFDSTLTKVEIVADSTGSAPNRYSSQLAGLIAYHGDSTLFVDPASVSMAVLDPSGRFVRTLAVPRARDVRNLIGGPFGTPGLDPQRRLVYRASPAMTGPPPKSSGPEPPAQLPDSAIIVRFDFGSRGLDTLARVSVPQVKLLFSKDDKGRSSLLSIVNPFALTDDWALLADGTVVVLRGQQFRVELFDATGKLTGQSKIALNWKRLSDDDKTALIDSARKDLIVRAERSGGLKGAMPEGMELVSPGELADYLPAFRPGAARADAEGNVWVRTTEVVNGGSVYYVINARGDLIDRVLVPAGRVIAGFGSGGTVYMGVLDGDIARLERARVVISAR